MCRQDGHLSNSYLKLFGCTEAERVISTGSSFTLLIFSAFFVCCYNEDHNAVKCSCNIYFMSVLLCVCEVLRNLFMCFAGSCGICP